MAGYLAIASTCITNSKKVRLPLLLLSLLLAPTSGAICHTLNGSGGVVKLPPQYVRVFLDCRVELLYNLWWLSWDMAYRFGEFYRKELADNTIKMPYLGCEGETNGNVELVP